MAKLKIRYTYRYMSTIGDPSSFKLTVADWRQELAGLTSEQIEHGKNNLPVEWPPNCLEFRQLCIGEQGDWQHNTAAYNIAMPKLEAPRDKSLGKAFFKQWRHQRKGVSSAD